MKDNTKHIEVHDTIIHITRQRDEDYISLTDMLKYKESGGLIFKWLSNKNTIEFLGVWEKIYNPDFNYTEFGVIMSEAGVNRFTMSVKQWIERTNAIGIFAKTGRYGGTYAHKDIAFELGTWISPEFKLLVIREFQRLKEIESNLYNLEWNVKRILSKTNYHIHTDAIKNFIIPEINYDKDKQWLLYAEEADLLNVALFKCSAKDWRESNPELKTKGMNIRDIASINELAVLSNLETLNAEMISKGYSKNDRYKRLKEISEYQLIIMNEKDFMKALKKLNEKVYIENKTRK